MPGATTGDPTHDKGHAEKTWQAKEKQDSRDSLDLLEHLPQNQILSIVYYIMPFTNSSDINRGLSLKKINFLVDFSEEINLGL